MEAIKLRILKAMEPIVKKIEANLRILVEKDI